MLQLPVPREPPSRVWVWYGKRKLLGLSFLKTSSAAEFLAFQPTGRGDFRKRCLNFSVGHRRGTRRGRMC